MECEETIILEYDEVEKINKRGYRARVLISTTFNKRRVYEVNEMLSMGVASPQGS